MAKNKYTVKYLSSFSIELDEIIYYVTFILKNPKAAERILQCIQSAIEKRRESPESYEIYKSKVNIKYDWYRIYIGNFIIFYTIRDDVMEIAHIIYGARNFDDLI